MKVMNVEELGQTKRRLNLQIVPEDISTEKDEAYSELSKEAVIPGFRKGKVPRKFLEMRFDKEIRKEILRDTVNKAIEDAAKEGGFRAIGRPIIDEEAITIAEEKAGQEPVEIPVTIEIIPPFDLPEYKGIELKKANVKIDDHMIDRFIDDMRERNAVYVPVDDRPVSESDFVVAEIKITRNGEDMDHLSRERAMIPPKVQENDLNLHPFMVGKNKGERFEFDIEIPQANPLFEQDGVNTLHVNARIRQINQQNIPAADDEFAKDEGFESMEELRKAVSRQLEFRAESMAQNQLRGELENILLEKTELAVPPSLIRYHYVRTKLAEGYSVQEIDVSRDPQTEVDILFRAEQAAKLNVILEKIAERENLALTDDEYFAGMRRIAASEGERNIDKFLEKAEKDGMEPFYREQFTHRKVLDWLISQANITDPAAMTEKTEG